MEILNTTATTPVTEPTSCVTADQLQLAQEVGHAVRAALDTIEARGYPVRLRHAGDYLIAFYTTPAQGGYGPGHGLRWYDAAPDATTHFAVVVLDAVDSRFVPGLDVELEVWWGDRLMTTRLPFEWDPVAHHYGIDAALPDARRFSVVIRIEAPTFQRHDQVNGLRYTKPVVVTLPAVEIVQGRGARPHTASRGADGSVARRSRRTR